MLEPNSLVWLYERFPSTGRARGLEVRRRRVGHLAQARQRRHEVRQRHSFGLVDRRHRARSNSRRVTSPRRPRASPSSSWAHRRGPPSAGALGSKSGRRRLHAGSAGRPRCTQRHDARASVTAPPVPHELSRTTWRGPVRRPGARTRTQPSHESAACNRKSLTLRPRSKTSHSGSSPLAT